MAFYVYIIESNVDKTFYKGFTEDYIKRFKEHNDGYLTTLHIKGLGFCAMLKSYLLKRML